MGPSTVIQVENKLEEALGLEACGFSICREGIKSPVVYLHIGALVF
jgi:hypothetical protein